jgi:hypothetical protein
MFVFLQINTAKAVVSTNVLNCIGLRQHILQERQADAMLFNI